MAIEIAERIEDPQHATRAALEAKQAETQTNMPGIIVSYDPAKQTAVVQPAIKGKQFFPDGTSKHVDMPLLLDVPVNFPAGGGTTMTFPVKAGDECLVHFGSRDMSAWWQSGGVQAPIEARMHDLSDAFCTVGIRSQKRMLTGGTHAANAQFRSDDGATLVEIDPAGKIVHIVAPGGLTIDATGGVTINASGGVTINAPTQITGASLKHNAKNVGDTHTHTGVQTGGGNTGAPA